MTDPNSFLSTSGVFYPSSTLGPTVLKSSVMELMSRFSAILIVVVIGIAAIFFFARQQPVKNPPPKLSKMTAMPMELDLSTTRPSSFKKFIVSVTSSLTPIAINKIHSWEIRVKTPDGRPVNDATITINGGMPMHQHGMPTAPRVTKNLGQGRYLLEGMKFSMTGWWELIVQIDAGLFQDNVTFNLMLR